MTLSAVAAAGNAILLYWMIRVTQRYVKINAKILAQTTASVDVAARQEQLTRKLFDDQLQQRIGPVIVSIDLLLGQVSRWTTLAADVASNRSSVLSSSEQLWSAEIDAVARAAGTLSLQAARNIIAASRLLRRVDLELAEARRRLREEEPGDLQSTATDVKRELLPLLDDITTVLGDARKNLAGIRITAMSYAAVEPANA